MIVTYARQIGAELRLTIADDAGREHRFTFAADSPEGVGARDHRRACAREAALLVAERTRPAPAEGPALDIEGADL